MNDIFRLYTADELGKDGYPPEWHERIKHEARVLAGDRCVRCRHPYSSGDGEWSACDERCTHRGPVRLIYTATDGSHVDVEHELATEAAVVVGYGKAVLARWRILTVHHLDGNKANCCWWNLAALCQRDHLYIQGRVRMERVYPWPHSDWFKPYVAGYYAFTYLGEELERPEVEARLDELLALELAA
jgi:hypothetical protein